MNSSSVRIGRKPFMRGRTGPQFSRLTVGSFATCTSTATEARRSAETVAPRVRRPQIRDFRVDQGVTTDTEGAVGAVGYRGLDGDAPHGVRAFEPV